MTSVFVAGSRAISKLNDQIKERLDNIMSQQLSVLVGDAYGADKAVQAYLAKCNYSDVIVYSMQACRNNVGDWPVRRHSGSSKDKHDRHYYGIKDLAMAKEADCGFTGNLKIKRSNQRTTRQDHESAVERVGR